jgi:hypothetical protein
MDACRCAVDALDHALRERPDELYEELVQAVRCIIRLRDELIEATRTDSPGARDRLAQVNAVLSVVTGGEYPLVGIRRERICQARDALAKLQAA